MTANKMPEMPDSFNARRTILLMQIGAGASSESISKSIERLLELAEDHGRACYLAGLEAARACVPAEFASPDFYDQWEAGHDRCRDQVLANLTALEQEAKK